MIKDTILCNDQEMAIAELDKPRLLIVGAPVSRLPSRDRPTTRRIFRTEQRRAYDKTTTTVTVAHVVGESGHAVACFWLEAWSRRRASSSSGSRSVAMNVAKGVETRTSRDDDVSNEAAPLDRVVTDDTRRRRRLCLRRSACRFKARGRPVDCERKSTSDCWGVVADTRAIGQL